LQLVVPAGVPKQRCTPFESGLQQSNFGGAQSQQSCRALTWPVPVPPQTSPSGLQLSGLRHRPTGGIVPVPSTHVMFPEPGPPTGPPQQSVSLVQMSPTTRHPEATWQTWPPVLVGTQSRLQQSVPSAHACPSTRHWPAPVVATAEHVPTFAPDAIEHSPEQQSLPAKQMSPNDAHAAPDEVQRPPWQLPEQHAESAVQVSPSVTQPPEEMAAQVPDPQVLLQQSDALAHSCPPGVHRLAPH
jgi:hypothetical protein